METEISERYYNLFLSDEEVAIVEKMENEFWAEEINSKLLSMGGSAAKLGRAEIEKKVENLIHERRYSTENYNFKAVQKYPKKNADMLFFEACGRKFVMTRLENKGAN